MSVAFFFNADDEMLPGEYGPPCTSRIVQALEENSEYIGTEILIGDMMPHSLVYKPSKVELKTSQITGSKIVSESQSADKDLYKTLLADIVDMLGDVWTTLNLAEFLVQMARFRIWSVHLKTLSINAAIQIDESLAGFSPYLGAAEIDLHNPILMRALPLIDGAFFQDNQLYYRKDYHDEGEALFIARTFGAKKSPILLEPDVFVVTTQSLGFDADLISERGMVSVERFSAKSQLSHSQKLARIVSRNSDDLAGEDEFEFKSFSSPEEHKFTCHSDKFKKYLLNKAHPKGGAKAKFFVDVLDIQPDDWLFLQSQILRAVKSSELLVVRNFQHGGLLYSAEVDIVGRNDKKVKILTTWKTHENGEIKFVTAYPSGTYEDGDVVPPKTICPVELEGDARWQYIYERATEAANFAIQNIVPTPMLLSGYKPVFQGMCGSAWVTVFDARTGMARWLKKNKIGRKGWSGGWVVNANPQPKDNLHWDLQSIEPKDAYARAFGEVLAENGVECQVESRLD